MKKIIILLFITAFLLSVLSAYSQGPTPAPLKASKIEQGQGATGNKQPNYNKQGTKESPIFVEIIPTNDIKNKPNTASDKPDNKSTPDYVAIFTGLLVIVGFMQLVVFGIQAHRLQVSIEEMKKATKANEIAANAARESADVLHVIEKSYVIVTVNIPDYKKMELGSNGADVSVCNCGRTPATIIKCRAILLGKNEPLSSEGYNILPGIELGSNKDITIFTRLSAADVRKLGKAGTYCHVILEYEDIFRQRYSKEATWEYKSSNSCPEGYWEPCENNNLNYYTENNTK
jgi:hypothetical protein